MWQLNIGASPSGKAAGFGPAISEVRILPPQKKHQEHLFIGVFSVRGGENQIGSNRASELRAKEFSLEQAKLVKRKSVDPLIANEQDTSAPVNWKSRREVAFLMYFNDRFGRKRFCHCEGGKSETIQLLDGRKLNDYQHFKTVKTVI